MNIVNFPSFIRSSEWYSLRNALIRTGLTARLMVDLYFCVLSTGKIGERIFIAETAFNDGDVLFL